jgi:type IV secretion system protein VirD4
MKRRLAWTGFWLVIGALVWLPIASIALCLALRTLDQTNSWAVPIAAFYYWRDYGGTPAVAHWLPVCAVGAGLLALMPAWCALFWPASQRLRVAKLGQKPGAPRRALSDIHGSADWMTMKDAMALFAGPHPLYGGVVVGEAYRVDQDKVANVRFDPDNRSTWGRGGTAPLLIDPCTADATHGAVFAGSGGYKTTAITIPTLAFWTGSTVVLDPSCQVGPMTAFIRRNMGHKVVTIGPGLDSFNVLDWIDPRDPLAETHVRAVIEHVAGETRANDAGENAMFKVRGRELLTCLLADLLWSNEVPADQKTLREFRQRVRTPEKKMRGLLADIHAGSESQLARDLAGSLMDVVQETFSGIYSNAVADTQWLSIKAYADMLSGDTFRTDELTRGGLSVFVQIPMDALRATPEVARVTIGALLSAVYRAEGHVQGRVLFLLDEVNFLGKLKALEDARDAGRKYGITLVSMWQSLGQLAETWGKDAKISWFNACSWRLFAVVDDETTATEVSRMAGRYTVLARTEGASRGTQSGLSRASRNRGSNEGLSEQPRELIRPDEVRTRVRADEAIIFRRGAPPLRCGRAIYFRRPELLVRIAADRYREAAE